MKGSVLTGRTLVLLGATALLVVAGALNFSQRRSHHAPPTDGATWVDSANGVFAEAVEPDSAAARARIIPGDRLHAISPNGQPCPPSLDGPTCEPIGNATRLQIYLDRAGVGGEIHYLIERPSFPAETRYYYADLDNLGAVHRLTGRDLYINLIGLVYLCIGLFVIFKQGSRAPFVLHFATLCLTAFVFHFYVSIASDRDLDLAIAILDNTAFILFAPLFLHFAAIYPVRHRLVDEKHWRAVYLYLPAIILASVGAIMFLRDQIVLLAPPLSAVLDYSPAFVGRYYRISFIHFVAALVISAAILIRRFIVSKNTVARQQLKWVVSGSALAIVPFTLLYGIGYVAGADTA